MISSEPYSVSFDDCSEELLAGANAHCLAAYRGWRSRPGYEDVVKFVEGFTHSYLFTIEPRDILDIVKRSSHPLGEVESKEQIQYIENFTTPFALQHLFHRFIEEQRRIPIWSEYVRWMINPPISALWYQPLRNLRNQYFKTDNERAWSRAVRWRLGKFYMSAIREIDIIAKLRVKGFEIKYHLFADVLLRVDFWTGRALVCTYFPNPKYRDGKIGRKPKAEEFFDKSSEIDKLSEVDKSTEIDKSSKFNIIHIPIGRQGFGRFWLADPESIDELCRLLASREP